MRTALFAMMALVVVPVVGVGAQGVQVSGRFGLAVKDDSYDQTCGDPHLTYGVDVQSRGSRFVQATFDRFTGSGGGDDICVAPEGVSRISGVDLENANRFLFGAGVRTMDRGVSFELAALGGFVSAKRGYRTATEGGGTHVSPQLGLRGSIIIGRVVVLALGTEWTRLSQDDTRIATNTTTHSTSWKPMGTMTFGLRLPAK